jgi:hypothetical protein
MVSTSRTHDDLPTIEGRPVYTRAHLVERYELGLSTLEALAREAAKNGHPASVGKVGKALAWDAESWDAWWRKLNDTTGLLTRADIARRRGVSEVTAAAWWADRDSNGHPKWKKKIGNTLYWDQVEHDRWTPPSQAGGSGNRAGDPDDEILLADIERICGVGKGSFTNYPTRPPRGWPKPIRTEPLPSGGERQIYTRSAAWDYDDVRGRHGGGRPPGPKVARRYPYDADPRLEVARQALREIPAEHHPQLPTRLAAEHGGAAGTWGAILAEARKHPEDTQ